MISGQPSWERPPVMMACWGCNKSATSAMLSTPSPLMAAAACAGLMCCKSELICSAGLCEFRASAAYATPCEFTEVVELLLIVDVVCWRSPAGRFECAGELLSDWNIAVCIEAPLLTEICESIIWWFITCCCCCRCCIWVARITIDWDSTSAFSTSLSAMNKIKRKESLETHNWGSNSKL